MECIMARIITLSVLLSLLLPVPVVVTGSERENLDYAQVIRVRAVQMDSELWRFDVTVRHNDEGWEHYADAWQVVRPSDGEVLAERVLAHPHVNEQPFTRSQSGVRIPGELTVVTVRAKCNVHGFGGREVTVDLSRSRGDNYEVIPLNK
jgi:hypothetical protein